VHFLPSHRLLLLLGLAAPVFLIGTAPALLITAAILALAAIDARRSVAAAIRVRRSFPSQIALGGEGAVIVTLSNDSDRALGLRFTDDLPAALSRSGTDVWQLTLAPGADAELAYTVRGVLRGTITIGDIHLRVLSGWGLLWHQRRVGRSDPVRIQPGLLELHRYRLLAHRNRLREMGLRSMRERGEGSSFESMREYIRGDDPRRIDWKASGRRGGLIVRQMEVERSQNVMLMLDAGRLMTEHLGDEAEGPWERFDHALAAALLLADVAGQLGDRVGLMVFSNRVDLFLPPVRGPLKMIARSLTDIHPRLVEPDYPGAFTYLGRHLRRRSLIVLFTDVIDHRASGALLSQLRSARRRHLPLAVALRNPVLEREAIADPVDERAVYARGAAEELLQVRSHALSAMQRRGVLVADTSPGDAVPTVINRYLEVKRRGLL
jgi:uncharacterized protein (DUF58 family)